MIKRISAYLSGLSTLQSNLLVLTLMAVVIAVTYFQTLGFNYCIDDQYYLWLFIEDGSSIGEYLASIRQRFWHREYRPVTFATILVEGLIFGRKPEVHHFFNLVYYLALCYLIYKVVSKYFSRYLSSPSIFAFLVALLFLLHPSHANVVSSIKNREVILSLTFGLLSMYTWWKYLDRRKMLWAVMSAILLLIGIFAKRDVYTFVLMVPLSGYLYNGSFKLRKDGLPILFYAAFVFGLSIVIQNHVAEHTDYVFKMGYFENPLITAEMTMQNWMAYSAYLLSLYEKFMVWPVNYLFYFGFDQLEVVNYWNLHTVLSFIGHLILAIAMIWLYIRKRFQYLLGPVIFFVAIMPFVINLVTGILSVRYSFIASLGFCIVLAQALFLVKHKAPKFGAGLVSVLFLVIFSGSAFFSHSRSLAWKDLYTLYATDLPKLKRSVNANRMAGQYYFLQAETMEDGAAKKELLERSLVHAEQALSVYSQETNVLQFRAKALGLLGRENEAMLAYDDWIAVHRTNTDGLNQAAAYAKDIKRYDKAIEYYQEVIKIDSTEINAYVELTQLYIYYDRFQEAISLNDALYSAKNHYDALLNYGDVYIASGDTVKSLDFYYKAILLQQEDFIIEEALRISLIAGDDTLSARLKKLLEP